MTRSRSLAFTLALTFGAVGSVWGQSVISAHSGTIHYTEGQVLLDETAVQPKFGEFPEVKSGQVLAAQDGRAEILLTPGVFLRLGENSSFKMISNQLTNTRLEIQTGQAMVEVGELLHDNAITVVFHGADVSIAKAGLYRFDSEPARMRVYEGEASVVSPSLDPTTVRKGHELAFSDGKLEARTFDAKDTDEFYRWSARRDEYVAEANISAAKTARDSGYSGMGYSAMGMTPGSLGSGVGMGAGMGSWAWNPWFGMFTYLPFSGTYFSPFGYGYFSPYAVGYMYGPYSPYSYGNGYSGVGSSVGIGRIGAVSSASAAAAPATAVTHAAGFAGGLSTAGASGARGGLTSAAVASSGSGSGGGGLSSGGGGLSSGGMGHASSGSGGKR
jgi:FecR protein